MSVIRLETHISAAREIVFDLSRSIDLHKLSTAHTHEEAIDGVTTGLVEEGDFVTWRAKHLGVYQKLTSRITACDIPTYFVDEMEKGAFKRFRHEHIFEEVDGKTLMIDLFDFEAPLGWLGKMADKLFLKSYMTNLLSGRNSMIKEFAETNKWKEILLVN